MKPNTTKVQTKAPERRSFLRSMITGAVALGLGIGVSSEASAAEFTYRLQANLNAGEPGYEAVQTHFADLVKEMSGGRIEIQMFPVGALYPVAEGLEGVGNGITEMALLTGGYFGGKLGPIANLETGVPGSLHTPLERYNFFYQAGFIDLAREAYAKYNVYYLGPQLSPSWDIMSTKPITSMADFKGLKIRSYGIEADWFQAMGATPVFMGGGEIYSALATGVVDAARWASPTGNLNNSFQEVAKYYVKPSPMPVPNNFFAINMDSWNALPDDLKAIMQQAVTAASLDYIGRAMASDAESMRKMAEAGVQVSQIDAEEWVKMEKIARGLWEKYADEDELAARGVKMLNDYLASLGR